MLSYGVYGIIIVLCISTFVNAVQGNVRYVKFKC
jgi:hypothetical protein